jgi:hypothetical protein
MILTLPAHTKLTFMDYLLTMLRSLLRRKQGHDKPLVTIASTYYPQHALL